VTFRSVGENMTGTVVLDTANTTGVHQNGHSQPDAPPRIQRSETVHS
jgi:hypothetical protein